MKPENANAHALTTSTGATTEAAGQTVADAALASGERWQYFTVMELRTILCALTDSGGMRSSHTWYLRCSALHAEITRALIPAPDSTRKRDGVAGAVSNPRPNEQAGAKGPSLQRLASNCCGASFEVKGDEQEGTHYYSCMACGKACDVQEKSHE